MIFTGVEVVGIACSTGTIGFFVGALLAHSKGYKDGAEDERCEQVLDGKYDPCGQEHGFGPGWFCTRVRGHDGPCALLSVLDRPRIANRR